MTEYLIRIHEPRLLERFLKFAERYQLWYQEHAHTEGVSILSKDDPYYEVARTGRNKTWSDDPETRTIQMRLHEKYVLTGAWDKMDDEDRQDATLGEIMVYHAEQPDYAVHTVEDTAQFIKDLKNGLYANTR